MSSFADHHLCFSVAKSRRLPLRMFVLLNFFVCKFIVWLLQMCLSSCSLAPTNVFVFLFFRSYKCVRLPVLWLLQMCSSSCSLAPTKCVRLPVLWLLQMCSSSCSFAPTNVFIFLFSGSYRCVRLPVLQLLLHTSLPRSYILWKLQWHLKSS
jgi:hypothetical protein